MKTYLRSAFLAAAIACLCLSQAFAAITGTISGVVSDPSGAALPGITVTATNQATGVVATAVTDDKGFYSFPALAIGMYTVNARQSGFKDFETKDIRIDANSSIRTDIQLTLGSVTETETVTADALQVETQNTQLGEVIDSAKITGVPLNGRAFTDLLALQPGVSPYQNAGGGDTRPVSGDLDTGNQSVNGGRESSNGFMINGADANEGESNGAGIIPNLDSIDQFRIITNNFDAEYGNFSGGQVNVVTKSGTNQFHGDVFEFLRNTDLDAKNFYSQTGRGTYIQNIFGGILGGPIKKNKVFFFGDFQGTKQIQGATQNYPVPSDAQRSGDLSDLFSDPNQYSEHDVVGAGWAGVLSNRLGKTVTSGEPYYLQDGSCTPATCVFPDGKIPTSAWDPAAVGMLQYIPHANLPNGNFNTSAFPLRLSDYKGSARIDATTRFGNLYGYYFLDNSNVLDPYAGASIPGFTGLNSGRAQMYNFGLITTFKNNSVNNFRVAYMRIVNHNGLPQGGLGVTLASLGFNTPWGPTGGVSAINPAYEGVPNLGFNNYSFGLPSDTLNQYNNTYQVQDSYTKIVGDHTYQFGIDYHYDQINERNYYGENGTFSFSGNESGFDFSDYLLGAPDNFIQASRQILDSRSHYFGAYAQDSWRITRSLTLNYGLRYEISTPWYDTQNKLEALIPGVQSVVFPGAPKGYLVPGDPGVARTLAGIRWNNFAPRFGFAYAPSGDNLFTRMLGGEGKSSIRGGFGIAYTNIQDATAFLEVGDAPFGIFYSSVNPPLLNSPFISRASNTEAAQPFPFTFPPTNVSPSNPDTTFNWNQALPISGALFYDTRNVVPYTESFYLGLQRELPSKTILSLNYVGTVGRKQLTEVESNPGNAALCLSLTPDVLADDDPNKATGCTPNQESTVYTLKDGTQVQGTRQPFGINFGSNPYMSTMASSSYNSFQATLQHTDKYAEFLIGYTFARSFDNGSAQNDNTNPFNPDRSRGLSSFDVHHSFVASYTVPIPFFGYGKQDTLLSKTLGGWSISGITTLATGLPVSMRESDDHSLTGSGGVDLPNYDPSGGKLILDKNPRHGWITSSKNYNANYTYFNPDLFSKEAIGQVGNSSRRFFSGPGLNHSDLALLKAFGFTEDMKLQFRAEAFNVFNHAEFNNPNGNINNGGQFGVIQSANAPRVMQIALKLLF